MEIKFLKEIEIRIKDKNKQNAIIQELESHILDKADYYMELGYSEEESFKRATEDMGDADDIIVPLNALHNVKWYKQTENFVALIILLIIFTFGIFYHRLFYVSQTYYICHEITSDFISTIIFTTFAYFLQFAYRRKNIAIASATIMTLIFQLTTTKMHTLFQPMLYAIGKTVTSGFSGYADSIFSYAYIPDEMKIFLKFGSIALTFLLIAYGIFVYIMIYRQERTLNIKKLRKPQHIIEKTICIFLTINFIYMSTFTAFAIINLNKKIEENDLLRADMIDTILNIEKDGKIKSGEEVLEKLENAGYELKEGYNGFYEGYFGNNMLNYSFTSTFEEGLENYGIFYGNISFDAKFCPLNKDLYYSLEELEGILGEPYYYYHPKGSNTWHDSEYELIYDLTLEEFLQTGIYRNAFSVSVTFSKKGEITTIDFMMALDSKSDKKFYTFSFVDGYIVSPTKEIHIPQ